MTAMPIINLNGTSPKELLQQQMDAMSAISVATHKPEAAAPNARDYQTAPRDAFAAAMNDHLDRVRRLNSVQAELDAIAQHIANSVANGAG